MAGVELSLVYSDILISVTCFLQMLTMLIANYFILTHTAEGWTVIYHTVYITIKALVVHPPYKCGT